MPTRSRFAGLKLDEGDRARLKQMETGGARMSVRTWRRVRTLLLLDLGYTVTGTAEALGTYRRETARIGKRYLAGGLEHALGDDPRPKPAPMLDSTQQAAIVAMVCGPPPEGRARWTVRLVAMEAVKRGIAPQLGRETARVALADHGLKPWREKMWCEIGIRRSCRSRSGVSRRFRHGAGSALGLWAPLGDAPDLPDQIGLHRV